MTMVQRAAPQASPLMALTETEVLLLEEISAARGRPVPANAKLGFYLLSIARLGGYL
ncbi:MAG: hypothetical protein WDN28_23445 [Chthoniobacter sp.]